MELEYSENCNSELEDHVTCSKDALREAVQSQKIYEPTIQKYDQCPHTRLRYHGCMKTMKDHNQYMQQNTTYKNPPKCQMELTIHGNCVSKYIQKAAKTNKKYLTEGGPDLCKQTRLNFENCVNSDLVLIYPSSRDPMETKQRHFTDLFVQEQGTKRH
eukprot:Platyproteum_vivax@DN3682_c0_g1_i1.p1